jgi:NADH-quinone oxidoreductase subunit L
MLSVLWLVPAFPLLGFAVLFTVGVRLAKRTIAVIGVGSVGLALIFTLLAGAALVSTPATQLAAGRADVEPLWSWFAIGGFSPSINLRLDPLSLVMTLVVTFVGFLIHLYSAESMAKEEGYARFFASMNLFVASMLILVLADNLLLLYLGWEGVGLCSYLLIGFWYRDPANGAAACKAFIVTRIGDTAMLIGLLLLATRLGTLDIQPALARAQETWLVGSPIAVAVAALLLGGAVGKSAQLPLQVWLPDAMAGPTPVSALIHAATMVTAGVYLIARTHVLFSLAPSVQLAVAVIGAATLLIAGFSALTQRDIKRILAYSTISQIGYMFLALGVGAWSAAILHLMTHAFFKALLFLSAGVVITAMHEEHDIFAMGGLRRTQPLAFWTFLIGSASLAAVPLVTAGFYSKDLILSEAWSSSSGGPWFWAAATVGAFLTSVYIFRAVFIVFFGAPRTAEHRAPGGYRPGRRVAVPLLILAVLSIIGGWIEIPPALGNVHIFSDFLAPVLPAPEISPASLGVDAILQIAVSVLSVTGIAIAYLLYLRAPFADALARQPAIAALRGFFYRGWYFDELYHGLFVRPFLWLARVNAGDAFDSIYHGVAALSRGLNELLSVSQNGRIRWYAAGLTFGSLAAIAVVLLS